MFSFNVVSFFFTNLFYNKLTYDVPPIGHSPSHLSHLNQSGTPAEPFERFCEFRWSAKQLFFEPLLLSTCKWKCQRSP